MTGKTVQSDLDRVTSLLERYMSRVNARVLLTRALQERGLSTQRPTRQDLMKCGASVRRGIQLFVAPTLQGEAASAFAEFIGGQAGPVSCRTELQRESDISLARSEARRLCEGAGASAFSMQKVTTIVSELARNIVLYAKQGTIEVVFVNKDKRNHIVVTAVDSGPGIPNLKHILSGQYQSRTGLGKGLLGTKRLADHFEIATSAEGTSITAEVAL